MPWSNQNGPWGGPGRGQSPWSQAPGGGGSNLEDFLRRNQERFKHFPTGFGSRWVWLVGVVLVVLWLASGFYTVGPNEVGLNLVFGRYTSKTGPGLNFNWPFPIGSVLKPAVTDRNAIDIGFEAESNSRIADLGDVEDVPAESLMLTGDQNIADVKFRVIWQIDPARPEDFVFNVSEPREAVKAVAESAMREIVGRTPIQGLLTADRSQIEPAAQQLIQSVLDRYKAGVIILQVQLLPIDPPEEVIAAFKDVTVAQQDKDRLQNEAETYANKVVPEARGGAAKIVQDAEAYQSKAEAEARGEAAAFDQVYASYASAPAITRERIYLDTMEKILSSTPKTFVDQKGASGIVPYLPLSAVGGASSGASK
jgi:modulator of FtsH protease HflK